MKYDFTSILDRKGKDAIAVDMVGAPGSPYPSPMEAFDVIPMWVADMNFPVCPTIQEHMIERAKHPIYGYFFPTDEYYNAIINWQASRNNVIGLCKEQIGYENGVLGGVVSAWTISALQMHPDGIIACDEAACGELKVDTYKYFKEICKDEK